MCFPENKRFLNTRPARELLRCYFHSFIILVFKGSRHRINGALKLNRESDGVLRLHVRDPFY